MNKNTRQIVKMHHNLEACEDIFQSKEHSAWGPENHWEGAEGELYVPWKDKVM